MRVISVLSLAVLSACASSSSIGTGRSTETVRASGGGPGTGLSIVPSSSEHNSTLAVPLDKAWRALPGVYQSFGIPLTTLDGKAHIIGNEGMKTRKELGGVPFSKYIDCGQTQIGPNADSYEIYLTVVTQLVPGENGVTKVTTTFQAAARPLSFAQEYARCSSKGVFEGKFAAAIAAAASK